MVRFQTLSIVVGLATLLLTGINEVKAQSCSCPPSCSAPPSCFAPLNSCCGIGNSYASNAAACQCSGDCRKKRTRLINIDFSRTVIKNNGGFWGEAPPASAMAISAMPVINVDTASIPYRLDSAGLSPASRGNDNASLLLELWLKEKMKNASLSSASAESKQVCEDPCGDILQLKQDVKDLKDATHNLTLIMQKLVDERTGS